MALFEWVLFSYFLLAVLYVLVFAIAGLFYKPTNFSSSTLKKIAVFVPGYKEDSVIQVVSKSHLQQDYPKDLFDVIILADSFKEETLTSLSKLSLKVMPVSFDKSSKAKSLNFAFQNLPEEYDIAVVLDADNVVQQNFLRQINAALNSGYSVVQAQRVAKNTNTSFAILDACSESINNHIFRKGPNAMGLSSSLIGSGMAFEYQLLKSILLNIDSVYEDREIQFQLAKKGYKIKFLNGVLVFDEKIDNSASFQNQRRRWLFAQFETLFHNFIPGHIMLAKGNFNYYNFAVLNNLFPPRIISLVFLFSISLITTFAGSTLAISWWVLFLLFCVSLAISIPKELYNKKLVVALFSIPKAFFKLFLALFKLKGTRTFIHTEHSKIDIDSVFNSNDSK